MKNKQGLILMVLISMAYMSCVSSKKFEQANAELNQLKTVNSEQSQKIAGYEKELAANTSKIKTLTDESSKLQNDMKVCTEAKETVSKNLNTLKGAIDEQYGSLQQLNDKAKADLLHPDGVGLAVAIPLGECDRGTFGPGCQLVWPGADRLGGVAVGALGFDDDGGGLAHQEQKVCIQALVENHHGGVVH